MTWSCNVMSVQCPGLLQEPFLRKLTMMAVNNDVAARRYEDYNQNNCIFSLNYYFSKHKRNLHSHFLIQDVCTAMEDYLRYLDPTEARTRIEATNLPQYKVQGSISFH